MFSASRAIQTGSFLGGYELLRRLATGGMAEVFLARQVLGGRSERLVVLKSILPGLADRPEFVSMFFDEARVAAQLQHANIVQILDVSVLGERPCIVMEYLNGFDAAWIYRRSARAKRPVTPAEVAALAAGAAYGLGYAHRKAALDGTPLRIVHRDVSPHNLFVTCEGVVKVLDFGIARTSQQIHTTQAGVLKGKIPYMSPEQMSGHPIDGRADLFGLGVIMWELATGTRLFRRETEVQSMQAVLFDVILPPTSVRPEIPAELDDIIARALDRDPGTRHASGEELARDLERFIASTGAGPSHLVLSRLIEELAEPGELDPFASAKKPITLETPLADVERILARGDVSTQPPADTMTAATLETSGARVRRTRRPLLWAGAVVAAALLSVLGWLAVRESASPDSKEEQEQATTTARPPEPAPTPPAELPAPPPAVADERVVVDPGVDQERSTRRAVRASSRSRPAERVTATPPAPTPPAPPPVAEVNVRPEKQPPPPRREETSGTGVSLDTDYQ